MISPDEGFVVSHRHFSHAMSIMPFELFPPPGSERSEEPGRRDLLGSGRSNVVNATIDQIAALGTSQWTGYSFAWFAGMLAEAGRGDEAYRYLSDYLAFTLRNGFHANGDQSGRGLSDMTYRPFTLEGNFLAMDAIQRMLLQSRNDTVELFPATPTAWRDASFERLRAVGGWVVSATRQGGVTRSVEITTRVGGTLRIADPTLGSDVRWSGAAMRREGEVWVGEVEKGGRVVGLAPPS